MIANTQIHLRERGNRKCDLPLSGICCYAAGLAKTVAGFGYRQHSFRTMHFTPISRDCIDKSNDSDAMALSVFMFSITTGANTTTSVQLNSMRAILVKVTAHIRKHNTGTCPPCVEAAPAAHSSLNSRAINSEDDERANRLKMLTSIMKQST